MKKLFVFFVLLLAVESMVSCGVKRETAKGKEKTEDFSDVLLAATKMPVFLSGDCSKWISENIIYPKSAKVEGKKGRVFVRFIVDKKGKVTNPQVMRSSGHEELDKEAIRVIGAMPAWSPGENEGKKVRVYYNFPISFTLP